MRPALFHSLSSSFPFVSFLWANICLAARSKLLTNKSAETISFRFFYAFYLLFYTTGCLHNAVQVRDCLYETGLISFQLLDWWFFFCRLFSSVAFWLKQKEWKTSPQSTKRAEWQTRAASFMQGMTTHTAANRSLDGLLIDILVGAFEKRTKATTNIEQAFTSHDKQGDLSYIDMQPLTY